MTFSEILDRTRLFVFKCVLRSLAVLGAFNLLARIAVRFVTERKGNENVPLTAIGGQIGTDIVLVLDWERFRGDLDIFAEAKDIRVFCISWSLLRYLLASFVYEPTHREKVFSPNRLSQRLRFAMAEPGSRTARERERYRLFLRRFLPGFLERLGVDLTMNSDYRFRREHDFIHVAGELGFSHICYFREAMYVVPAIYEKAIKRYRIMAPFRGSVMAVQNEVTGQIFVESGMTTPDKTVVRGCPRMDEFLQRLQRKPLKTAGGKRQIAFFSWPPHVPLGDGTKFDLFTTATDVVRALAELARDDPTLQVILKIKDQHMKGGNGGQISRFREVIGEVAGEMGALPNVIFETERMATHDVILESDIICAMQTTVVLEAAIAGKAIVLPHFQSLKNQPGADRVLMYQEHRDLFEVPDNVSELKEIVMGRFDAPNISSDMLDRRRELFDKFVSPMDGRSTRTTRELIKDQARRSRANRRVDA